MYLPSKTKFKYIVIILAFIGLFLFSFWGFFQNILIFFSRQIFLPPQKLTQEFKDLEKENLSLKLQLDKFSQIDQEHKKLKKALQFKEEKDIDLVGASIIFYSPSNWRRIVLINAGHSSGLSEGFLVIDENKNLIGFICDAKEDYSEVILVTDPNFSLPVFIGDNTLGLLKGNITEAKVLYVESIDTISKGEKIYFKDSNLGLRLPVGQVKSIRKNPNSLFYDIEVKLFVMDSFFNKVFVIKQ